MRTVTSSRPAQPLGGDAWNVAPAVLAAQARERQDADDLRKWRSFDLDWQIFDRVRAMNVAHADHAWERRYTLPIGAYGIAFLFHQPAPPGSARDVLVTAATRLWRAGPEAENLTPLLAKLDTLARDPDRAVGWDLRTNIANRRDPQMAEDAVYLGLGVSSLDTYTGTWPQVLQSAHSSLDISGTIRIISANPREFTHERVVVADRRAANQDGSMSIHSHHGLSKHLWESPYPYAEASLEELLADPQHGHILRWMHRLHLGLADADQHRRNNHTHRIGQAEREDQSRRAATSSHRDSRRRPL